MPPWTDDLFPESILWKNLLWQGMCHFIGWLPPSSISDQSFTSKRPCSLVLILSLLPVCHNVFSFSDVRKYSTSLCYFLKQDYFTSVCMATEGCNSYVAYSGCECASRKPFSHSSVVLGIYFCYRIAFALNQLTKESSVFLLIQLPNNS